MKRNGVEYSLPRRPFGLIVPNEAGVRYVHQAGGVAITYRSITGVYLPLSEPVARRDEPEWYEVGVTDVTDIAVEELSDTALERLPDDVVERGGFLSAETYRRWLQASPHYGNVDLLRELEKYNYFAYNTTAEDPVLERWDDETEIWDAIDEALQFEYEGYDYEADPLNALPKDAAEPVEALRWIRITGTKTMTQTRDSLNDDGKEETVTRKLAYWAEELEGTVVAMVYPNSD